MRDEHCHIIWDVDDGSRTLDESLAMLDEAQRSGINQIVATPHMRWDDFNQTKIEAHFSQLREHAADRGITLTLAYEVYYKTLLQKGLNTAPLFVEQDTNNITLEFNTASYMVDGWDRVFYELQTRYGLDITVAHPERYLTVLEDFDTVYRMKDMGCRVQVSAGDLFHKSGLFSRSPLRHMAKCARRIIDEGLCDALVSDAHNPSHYDAFRRAVNLIEVR